MHDQRTTTIERARQLLRHHIVPAIHPAAEALAVDAHHVHGEPISRDEAMGRAFEPFAVGLEWGGRWDTTWFRLRGRVPESWQGGEVAVRLDVGHAASDGFGSEALVWGDRGPEQGLSPFHNEHVITKKARGGEDVDVLIEAAANPEAPFGQPRWPDLRPDFDGPPIYRLARADLVIVDRNVYRFAHDFRTVLELAEQLPAQELRGGRALAALARSCDAIDRSDVAGSVAAASRPLHESLDLPAGAGAHRLMAVGHAHIDTAWLWPLRETVRKCARTFSSAVRLMDEYPEYHFACSQPQQWAWMKDHYPELFARMKEKVATGQFEPVGAMWVEADCNVPSGESLVRQIVHGKRFFLDELGVDAREVWLPDVFGYSASLPQIMALAGVRWFLTQKISWNDTNTFPHNTFWWEGIDGSRVFTHFPPADTYNGDMSVQQVRHAEHNFKDHGRSSQSLYLFGYGDGGGGPTRDMIEAGRRLADLDGVPRVTFGTAADFFASAEAEARDLAVWAGELYFELHRGTYTTQARTKRGNRKAELALRDAELWAALRPDSSAHWPAADLDSAWKTLLLHQFHDIIPGSSIGWVYDETERDHRTVVQAAEDITAMATAALAAAIDTRACTAPVLLCNSLSHARHEMVEVPSPSPAGSSTAPLRAVSPDGRDVVAVQRSCEGTLLFPARVPSIGYAVYDLRDGDSDSDFDGDTDGDAGAARATSRSLSNGILTVTIDDDGLITSILDHEVDREVVAADARANVLQLFDDHPNQWDAWDIDRAYRARGLDLTEADSIEVVEDGPHRASLRIVRSFGSSRVTQRVSLMASSRRIDFVTEVQWHEERKLLKVAFPVGIHARRATYEIQYGHVERPTHENTSWDEARFEVCAHKWVDLSEADYGVALLNDCKYGHDIHGNVMRLSLLRSPLWPDPNADRGQQQFTYSLLPHPGPFTEAGVIERAYELNVPVRCVPLTVPDGAASGIPTSDGGRPLSASLITVDKPGVVIETIKRADAGDALIVRLYEAWGSRGPLRLDVSGLLGTGERLLAAARTDLLERELEPAIIDRDGVRLTVRPFEIVTLALRIG